MSLFGSGQPILYRGTTAVAMLGNSKIERMEPSTDDVTHESKLDRKRNFISRGTHLEIDIRLHLFKWDPAYQAQNFVAFYALKGQTVSVKPYEGAPTVYKQANGDDALFFIREVYPFYLDDALYRDAVRFELVSCDPIDFGASSWGSNVKTPVFIAANYNVPLSDQYNIIDNGPEQYAWRDFIGLRVLLTAQTAAAENGIYIANGNYTALTRASDCDTWAKLIGATAAAQHGLFINSVFRSTAGLSGTINVTNINWVRA
jgi:hypothetical protein